MCRGDDDAVDERKVSYGIMEHYVILPTPQFSKPKKIEQ